MEVEQHQQQQPQVQNNTGQQNVEEDERDEATRPLQTETGKDLVKDNFEKMKKKFLPGLRFSLLISLAFDVAMFVIGVMNVHKCPVNDSIPLFLIATGAIALFSAFITYLRDRIIPYMETKQIETVLYTSQLVFLVLGMYWVFKVYKPEFDPMAGDRYCNKTAYMFAFVYIVFILCMVAIIPICFCCFLFCICFVVGTMCKKASSAIDEATEEADVESGAPINRNGNGNDAQSAQATTNTTTTATTTTTIAGAQKNTQ